MFRTDCFCRLSAAACFLAAACLPLSLLAQEGDAPEPEAAPSAPEAAPAQPETPKEPAMDKVLMKTSLGDIAIELDAAKAPLTVANFLAYVDAGFYNGTIFHRVISNFMVQGGGFTPDMRQKPTRAPVKNEAANGLSNKRGTIAMARTMVVDSATAQFFINVVDNPFLDFRAPNPQGFGYCVFGRVTDGMDVVDKIKAVPTGFRNGMGDVPLQTVEILSVERVK
jgi:peptidyl-prolyl cis-trans isomerase B (cyclophilin B)